MTFPETFLTPSKPGKRPITAAKKKQNKGKKGKEKKTFQKSKSLKL